LSFGHTHVAFLKKLEPSGKIVLNTGTWLTLLSRIPVRFGFLPAVYYPSYRLNYFLIKDEDRQLVIEYVSIPKTPELTRLQRALTFGRRRAQAELIPARTTMDL
jgi:hypothetical protein